MSSTNTKCRYRFVSLTAEGMYVWWFEPQAEAQCSRFSSPNTVYICPYIHQTAMGKGGAGKGAAPKRWPRVLTSADDSWLPWFALACRACQACHDDFIHLHSAYSALYSVKLCWELGASMNFRHRMESQPGSPKTEGSSHFPASGPERGRDDRGCLEGLDVGWCCLILMETGPASLILQEPFLLKHAILEASLTRSSLRHRKHLKAETGDDRLSASLLSSLWGINLECRYPTCQPKGANSDSNSASHFLRWGDSSVYIQLLGVIRIDKILWKKRTWSVAKWQSPG